MHPSGFLLSGGLQDQPFYFLRLPCPAGPDITVRRLRLHQSSTEKTGKERNKGGADERHTAAGHELLHALGLRAG